MRELLGRLRVRLALAGFVAIYAPVLVLVTVTAATEDEVMVAETSGGVSAEQVSSIAWEAVGLTAVLLAPVAAAVAWWWAGRAVRPVDEAIALQEQLIAETSHELRTPLSILRNNAEVLLDHPAPTLELYRSGLERTSRTVERMSATVEALLVDARNRARTLTRSPTDLAHLVRAAVADLRPLADEREVTVTFAAEPGAPIRAPVDGPSVQRAVTNLIVNAIQASPPNGEVAVTLAGAADKATVAVTDRGPGIAARDLDAVFDRFSASTTGGAGLGLSIARQIARAHGGDVTIASPIEAGGGTRAELTVTR